MSAAASGQVLWSEIVSGDASNDPLAPSNAGSVVLGSNVFSGTMASDSVGDTRDFITFTVPAGMAITQMTLITFSPDNTAWAHFDDGPTSVIPSPANAATLLAGAHVAGSVPDGTDLFPNFQTGAPGLLAGPGFNGSIGPGTYTFLIQQTSSINQDYSFDFVVVPAPGFAAVGTIGMLFAARRRR
jgi:hypothetical protein